jgi:hypothetical protein
MATTYGLPIANSALQLISWGVRRDGVYLINLPVIGRTLVYCLLDSKWDGGGWMMMMKATTGITFGYDTNYWTTNNTLNANHANQNNGDAKFDVMNYYQGKDFLARWPDITTGTGGSISGLGSWIWLQNNYNDGVRITPISFFSTASRKFVMDAKTYSGWANGIFSSQVDVRFYGFNYFNNNNLAKSRWGFGWNENGGGLFPNGDMNSDDVVGGIGLKGTQAFTNGSRDFSAGDVIGCCADTIGINRSARVEVYVR